MFIKMEKIIDEKVINANKELYDFKDSLTEDLKNWRRARSDMQLFFVDLRRRETLREEFDLYSESITNLIAAMKYSFQLEPRTKELRSE